jgi:hypothetical protein
VATRRKFYSGFLAATRNDSIPGLGGRSDAAAATADAFAGDVISRSIAYGERATDIVVCDAWATHNDALGARTNTALAIVSANTFARVGLEPVRYTAVNARACAYTANIWWTASNGASRFRAASSRAYTVRTTTVWIYT